HRRPARAAVFHRPLRPGPALASQDAVPLQAYRVFAEYAGAAASLPAQLGRELRLQKGAHFVAKGFIRLAQYQCHGVSSAGAAGASGAPCTPPDFRSSRCPGDSVILSDKSATVIVRTDDSTTITGFLYLKIYLMIR